MTQIRQGALAGLSTSLVLAALLFVSTREPGHDFHSIASWLGLDSGASGRWIGFFIVLVLGTVFGVLFALLPRQGREGLGYSIIQGLATGLVFWLIVPILLGTVVYHHPLDLPSFLFSFVLLLFYGALLGMIFFRQTTATGRAQTLR